MGQNKFLDWIKNNQIFLGILLFTIGIRLYYFFLVGNQPLWWDSSEYLNIARRFAFGEEYNFGPVRPILLSLIFSIFLRISDTELLPRLFILLISVLSVAGMYYLGREIYGKVAGIVASFLMSIFYLNLFFTYRLLVDLPGLAFFIFSALFFYKYCYEKKPKFLYLASGLLAVGTLLKLSIAFAVLPFAVFALIVFGIGIFKRKEVWLASLLFLLILAPYIIWGYLEFGGFVLTQASGHVAHESYLLGFGVLKTYLVNFPTYFSWGILIACIFGIFSMFVYGSEKGKLKKDIFVLLILILPLILISFTVNHNEDRYIFIVFPSVFLLASSFVSRVYNIFREKKKKVIAVVLVILFLGMSIPYHINFADALIKDKVYSYADVKQAGLWMRENSVVGDVVATRSQPQTRYYSGLKTIGIPPTEQEFEESLNPDVKFFIISIFESHPEWSFNYPEKKNLTIEHAYVTPDQRATLIIYRLQ